MGLSSMIRGPMHALIMTAVLYTAVTLTTTAPVCSALQLRSEVSLSPEEELCASFRNVSSFVVAHCPTLPDALENENCLASFQLFADSAELVLACESAARASSAPSASQRRTMDAFLKVYTAWQENHTCELFHEKEKRAALDCGPTTVHRPWAREAWPLHCDEIFQFYDAHRQELDAVCERSAFADDFWEAYADFIADTVCKTYYTHVRATKTQGCDSDPLQLDCAAVFTWYRTHQREIETKCLEVQDAKPFYKGFYAWKHHQARYLDEDTA